MAVQRPRMGGRKVALIGCVSIICIVSSTFYWLLSFDYFGMIRYNIKRQYFRMPVER